LVKDPLSFLTELSQTHGDIATFWLGRAPAVFINDPELIDCVVRDRAFVRSEGTRSSLTRLLGQGLLTLEGAAHLRHRRLMQPAFHRERIQRYVSIMAEETEAVLRGWRSGELPDLRTEMSRLTFAIVSRCLFNADTRRESERINTILQRVTPIVMTTGLLSWMLPRFVPPLYGLRTRREIRELHEIVSGLVQTLRAEGRDRGDLLSMLLASRDDNGRALSDDDIRDETLTTLLAGYDTTTHAVTLAWHLLSTHPEIQEAVADEVRTAVGERPIVAEDLERLPLVDRVVREALRLYPPAWWADRVCSEDRALGGYLIPAGTMVVFSTWVTHRDARYFADPSRFDPDRFLRERAASIPSAAYLPFGAGVHTCIGNTFALTASRMIIAAMAQRFSFRANNSAPLRIRAAVILTLLNPLPVVLTRRSRATVFNA
jgi:cytochrome P450